jgi:hypothetical protein
MKAIRRFAAMSLLLLGVCTEAGAQSAAFVASLDRPAVGLGEQFTLSFTLSNAGLDGGKNLRPPDMGKFRIMSGPNRSSSVQIVNGSISSSVVYSYLLEPKDLGKFTVGSATIEADGKILTSDPLTVEVVKAAPKPARQSVAPAATTGAVGDNLFLKATVDRTRVLQGEQINLVFKLYTRVSINNYAVEKNPNMTGFWGEEVEVAKDIRLTNETVNGKQYRVGIIKRMALFPTQPGNLEISPMEIQTTVQVQDRRALDPFDSFFRDPFGRAVNYKVSSDAIKVRVDPLPPAPPDDFKGAVGQFAMSTSVDKKTTRTNEPVNLKVTISGTGNIKLIESPFVDLPVDFEQYTPKVSDNINRTGEKVAGSKTFEYLLIPRYPGVKVIKPVGFSFYDPVRREYVKLRSPQIDLNVEQGTAPATPLIAGGTREDVRMLSQDIRFIKLTGTGLSRGASAFHTSGLFLAMLVTPLAGLAGAFVYARRRQAVMLDQAGYRNRKAMKVARKGLKQAEYLLKEQGGNPAPNQRLRFYGEVSHALWKYLGDKLNIPQAAFSVEGAATELRARGTDPGLTAALRKILETCDMARFAPTSLEVPVMQKTYDEAGRLIVELERTLK